MRKREHPFQNAAAALWHTMTAAFPMATAAAAAAAATVAMAELKEDAPDWSPD